MAAPAEPRDSFVSRLGRRLLAGIVLVVAVILLLKIVGAIVIGFITTVLTIAALVVLGVAVMWALRRL